MDKVYSCVCENPGESLEEMSEELEMPHGNIDDVLDELESAGLVRFKSIRTSPVAKRIYPVEKEFLMNANMKKELKKFMDGL
jgi:predicted transcriptional regulator